MRHCLKTRPYTVASIDMSLLTTDNSNLSLQLELKCVRMELKLVRLKDKPVLRDVNGNAQGRALHGYNDLLGCPYVSIYQDTKYNISRCDF